MKQRKTAKKPKISFWGHWLAEDAPESTQDQFTKLCWLTSGAIRQRVKIISNPTYLI